MSHSDNVSRDQNLIWPPSQSRATVTPCRSRRPVVSDRSGVQTGVISRFAFIERVVIKGLIGARQPRIPRLGSALIFPDNWIVDTESRGLPRLHARHPGNGRDWSYPCVSGGCSAKISCVQRCLCALTCGVISLFCSSLSHSPLTWDKVHWGVNSQTNYLGQQSLSVVDVVTIRRRGFPAAARYPHRPSHTLPAGYRIGHGVLR